MNRVKFAIAGLLLVLATLALTETAGAQFVVRPWYRPRYRGRSYGGGSYASGMANLIRAQGMARLQNAQAAVNYEQARSKYIDNKQKWTQNYFQMREQHQQYAAKIHDEGKHSAESLTNAAKSSLPLKLGADALDPVTGHITWPSILKGGEYAAQRTRLEELFELRAKTSLETSNADKIHAATSEMTAKLREKIESIPVKQYIAGRKFLDSLDYTAQSGST